MRRWWQHAWPQLVVRMTSLHHRTTMIRAPFKLVRTPTVWPSSHLKSWHSSRRSQSSTWFKWVLVILTLNNRKIFFHRAVSLIVISSYSCTRISLKWWWRFKKISLNQPTSNPTRKNLSNVNQPNPQNKEKLPAKATLMPRQVSSFQYLMVQRPKQKSHLSKCPLVILWVTINHSLQARCNNLRFQIMIQTFNMILSFTTCSFRIKISLKR